MCGTKQDYNNELAQLRAGKSSKSKLLIAKFKSADSLEGWEVRQGTYFQDVIASKYDGGMDAKFEYTENGAAIFSGTLGGDQVKLTDFDLKVYLNAAIRTAYFYFSYLLNFFGKRKLEMRTMY